MENVCLDEKCFGCSLCEYFCKSKAISINFDSGFYRPTINNLKCTSCKLCIKNCPANNLNDIEGLKNYNHGCYAGWSNDSKIHFECASGGIATEISRQFIKNGGFVVGTVYDDNRKSIIRICIEEENELLKISKSKYVHSDKTGIYQEIVEKIKEKKCLFIGVPCEVFAIKQFCKISKIDETSIYCIDLLCRGGASPKYFKEHQNYLERKIHGQATNVTFRGGRWDCWYIAWHNDKIIYKEMQYLDAYFLAFMKHIIYQPICYECPFSEERRIGDITLADFWGVNKKIEEKNPTDGVNLILTNTIKGDELFNSIQGMVTIYEQPFTDAVNGNSTLREPTEKGCYYNLFWKLIEKNSFEKVINLLYKNKIAIKKMKIHRVLSFFLPIKIKEKLKEFLKNEKI